MDIDRPLSPNERIKANSNLLRGTIAEGLTQTETGSLADDDTQLTKFHGFYQQDDRDLRAERGKQRMEKAFSFMVRMRVPAGILSPKQWLKVEKLAVERANHTIRLTTRETVQFHGILKGNLKPLMQGLHADLMDTIAACGDVNRNVIATADPWRRDLYAAISDLARNISGHLLPRTRAWHEIWLDEEKVSGGEVEDEPILGRTYLPRKFKIAIALPPHNDVDVFAHDLGFIAIVQRDRIIGYNVVVGGGMGMTHGEPETYPRTGDVIGFCKPEHAVDVAEAVVTVQRDYGDRSNRKHARLKYTIDDMGIERFAGLVNERLAGEARIGEEGNFHLHRRPAGLGAGSGWHRPLYSVRRKRPYSRPHAGGTARHRRARRRPLHHDAEPEFDHRRYSVSRARQGRSFAGRVSAGRPGQRTAAQRDGMRGACRPAAWHLPKANVIYPI